MKACLFDLDGTLAASEVLKARALAGACASYGIEKADHALYAEVMGQDWDTVTSHFFQTYRIDADTAEFNNRFRASYLGLIEMEIAATDGAKEFIQECRSAGLVLGLVSSADSWMVDKVLQALHLEGAFDLVITKNDVSRHKPHPEAYLLAMSRLRLDRENVVVFEDSAAGLMAATRAGCRCVVIRHSFNVRHDLSRAFIQIESFRELLGVKNLIASWKRRTTQEDTRRMR